MSIVAAMQPASTMTPRARAGQGMTPAGAGATSIVRVIASSSPRACARGSVGEIPGSGTGRSAKQRAPLEALLRHLAHGQHGLRARADAERAQHRLHVVLHRLD